MGGRWGSSLPSASGLSPLFCCTCTLQPSRNFGQITATSTILRDCVKLSFGWKKKNPLSSFGVEISIMLRDTVLPTAVRDVVTNSSPSSEFISDTQKWNCWVIWQFSFVLETFVLFFIMAIPVYSPTISTQLFAFLHILTTCYLFFVVFPTRNRS